MYLSVVALLESDMKNEHLKMGHCRTFVYALIHI